MYIDTHTHFDLCMEEGGVSEESIIAGLRDNGIGHSVQISIEADNLEASYNFAEKHRDAGVHFSLGIHPSSAASEKELSRLSSFTARIMESKDSELLFGIGETGLDFYRMRQPADTQVESFNFQIDLAKKWGLPVIVHSRDAFNETINILTGKRPPAGIMHCFPGNREMAKKVLDLGFYISFAGNVTYNKAHDLHEAASYVPADRLLLETDAPFLAPVPQRGKKNRSEYIIHTYNFICELRKEKLSALQDSVYNNFMALNNR